MSFEPAAFSDGLKPAVFLRLLPAPAAPKPYISDGCQVILSYIKRK